jgi:hypothetical protein
MRAQGRSSLFQSVGADDMKAPAENQFVAPPLDGSVWRCGMDMQQTLPPKGGTTNYAFHSFKASQRDMNNSFSLNQKAAKIVQNVNLSPN